MQSLLASDSDDGGWLRRPAAAPVRLWSEENLIEFGIVEIAVVAAGNIVHEKTFSNSKDPATTSKVLGFFFFIACEKKWREIHINNINYYLLVRGPG